MSPSFTNTYSLSFDGVGDIVNFQNDWFAPSTPSQTTGNTVGSVSFWVKLPTNISSGGLMGMVSINVGGSSKPLIWLMFNRSASSVGRYIRAYVSGANSTQTGVLQTQQFFVYDDSSTTYPNSGISFTADTWYHIAVVYDKNATNRYKAYINGNEFLIPNTTGTGSNGERTIGEMPYSLPYNPTSGGIYPNIDLGFSRTSASGGTQYFEGNLDEVAFWNSALTAENVTSIFDDGTPNDLTSLNPSAWYRNGDNGSYKSPQWLIPENSNKDKVSNYSFDFDGVDDYVIAPLDGTSTGGILAATYSDINLTISLWFKLNSAVNRQGIFQWGNELADATPFVSLQQWITSDRVRFYVDGAYQTMVNVNLGQWYNIILTRTASDNTYRGYLDGVEFFAYDDGGSITQAFWDSATDIYLSGGYFGGAACNVDEVAVWNSVQDVASIYNSGTPTTITGAVAHWKMGEEATFSTNWTVPDQVGSNDGTSANMTIEDRVGDAPNSTSNALSYNMTESDRETDVPS